MKKTLVLIALLFGLTFNAFASELIDRIVAVVNDDVVTQTELDSALKITRAQIQQSGMTMPTDAALHKQVLDQLINKKIQLQIAKTVGISISDQDIDNAVNRIASQNNITDQELYTRVGEEGFSVKDYRGELREQMTIQKLQQQEVVNRIVIAPDEVNNFLNSKAWATNGSKEYHLADILIPVSDTPSPAELAKAKSHAETLIAKINKGANFNSVAQSESASNALQGGDLGWRSLAEIPSAFADEVTKMQKGKIAGPIQTSNGFHVLQLVDVRNSGEEKAPDRKQVENLLMQRKFEEAVQNWVSRLRGQAYISVKTEKA